MEQFLQLNIGQHLTLTPQLQQAIKLLQLSTLDLQKEIQQILDSNPMLDTTPSHDDTLPAHDDESAHVQWAAAPTHRNSGADYDYHLDNMYCATSNLQDHLLWQLNLSTMSDIDRMIATTLIDAINEDGFLTMSLAEIHASLMSPDYLIDFDEVLAVQHRIQLFDPVGCGCSDLAETLLVQIEQLAIEAKHLEIAKKIIQHHIELLGQHNYRQLMKIYQISETTIKEIVHIIQKLNPKPGSLINQAATEYVIPDVSVRKVDNEWRVNLNNNTLPQLAINQQYAALIKQADNQHDATFLKNNLQEARWFLKSIQSRQETLFKVAQCIVHFQKEFLEWGEEAMKPLVLSDVAHTLDMHESTISRVTTQKFINTPRGVFELKYFFSSHVATQVGGECSSTAIRAMIKKLVASENRKKPLSDNKMAQLLEKQGIQVARRTVAKYRESLGISPSNERKLID